MTHTIEKIKYLLIVLIIAGTSIFLSTQITGCKSVPKALPKEPKPCFDFRMCMYYMEKRQELCIDFAKECRAFRRFNKCKIEKMTFEKCWLYLNQK